MKHSKTLNFREKKPPGLLFKHLTEQHFTPSVPYSYASHTSICLGMRSLLVEELLVFTLLGRSDKLEHREVDLCDHGIHWCGTMNLFAVNMELLYNMKDVTLPCRGNSTASWPVTSKLSLIQIMQIGRKVILVRRLWIIIFEGIIIYLNKAPCACLPGSIKDCK